MLILNYWHVSFSSISTQIFLFLTSTVLVIVSAQSHVHRGYETNKKIPVEMRIRPAPNQLHGKLYLTTGTSYNLSAEITDEYYKNLTLTYQWSVMSKTIVTGPNVSQIEYTFTEATEKQFIMVLVVHQLNETGMSREEVIVYEPIVIKEFKGDSVLTQGDLLNATLKFTGTVPVKYEYKICPGVDFQPNCHGFEERGTTSDSAINLVHYLRSVGDYTLLFRITNNASSVEKCYHVKIVDSVRIQRIAITPIVCSIAAVLVMAAGLMVHLKLRRASYTESAGIDFTRSAYEDDDDWAEQWDQEQSFMQRVRYLIFSDGHADGSGQSISSILRGSRDRFI